MANLAPLVLGLVVFLGAHLVTRVGGLKARVIATKGEQFYFTFYSMVSLLGAALIAHGFGVYRASGMIPVWDPPRWMPHLAIPLIWAAFVILASTWLPGRIKARMKHPMLVAVKIWALAHLLANGDLGSIILFGAFLGWAIWLRILIKRRGGQEIVPGARDGAGSARNDIVAVVIGSLATALFVFWLHKSLIGVAIIPL